MRAGGAASPKQGSEFSAPGDSRRSSAGGIAADAQDYDAVTLESNLDDWEFDIWVDAILEDYPDSELENGEVEESEEG